MNFILIIALSIFANAQNHEHGADHLSTGDKNISTNKQFIPTGELKIRMENILSIMTELSKEKDKEKNIKEYGLKVANVVNEIFKTCKLEADADAAIHPSLGLILQGSKDFKEGKYESGHKKIHKALLDYEKVFKHDGWKH